jgi:hypothetical protein
MERFAVDAHDAPFAKHVSTHLFVEIDSGLIPVQDVPLEAIPGFQSNGSKAGKEGFCNAFATEGRADE